MRCKCWMVLFPIGLGLLSTGYRRVPEPHNTDIGYQKSIEDWRAERLEGLKKPMSWLRLAGLFWLKRGKTGSVRTRLARSCPVPRNENRLPIRILAGEKAYSKH